VRKIQVAFIIIIKIMKLIIDRQKPVNGNNRKWKGEKNLEFYKAVKVHYKI